MNSGMGMAWIAIAGTQAAATAAQGAGATTSAAGALAGWTLVTAIALGVVALILLLPATTGPQRLVGGLLALFSMSLLLTGMMLPLAPLSAQWIFWGLAAVTLIGAVAAVVTRKPVYTALWFAMSLLGTAGLLLFNGAEFLSISTVAVYAGAILVTFLFVLMLAQPEGHASYDRITWGWYVKATAAAMAGLLVAMLAMALSAAGSTWVSQADASPERVVLDRAHLARFGGELFSKHLLSIEIAGAILLVALVGAIAIMLQTAQAESEMERRARP